MSMAIAGLLAGMALGFAGYFGGFGAFLLVAALGAVGFVVGRFLDGDLDPGDLLRPRDRGGRGDRGDQRDRRR
ncbi:hypothetical protein [Streptomyces xanthophaeus]|uniref:DUF2273 domain-containing protein n=1 Tax=Streptomyces xanthophaeus TaxID=67385 RepID=A0A919GUV5_9ACTN|nr:hypothetical protein [Streptomyces xanthophaeus]GHI84730.1 hypothetical protein Sxan_20940 [Streptomyces xanthophaeus]